MSAASSSRSYSSSLSGGTLVFFLVAMVILPLLVSQPYRGDEHSHQEFDGREPILGWPCMARQTDAVEGGEVTLHLQSAATQLVAGSMQ